MKCPKCSVDNNLVLDTREREDYHKRVRQCINCGYIFTTREEYIDTGYKPKNPAYGAPKWLNNDARKNQEVNWDAIKNARNEKLRLINERIKNEENKET